MVLHFSIFYCCISMSILEGVSYFVVVFQSLTLSSKAQEVWVKMKKGIGFHVVRVLRDYCCKNPKGKLKIEVDIWDIWWLQTWEFLILSWLSLKYMNTNLF